MQISIATHDLSLLPKNISLFLKGILYTMPITVLGWIKESFDFQIRKIQLHRALSIKTLLMMFLQKYKQLREKDQIALVQMTPS
jgi:hypothetical protein